MSGRRREPQHDGNPLMPRGLLFCPVRWITAKQLRRSSNFRLHARCPCRNVALFGTRVEPISRPRQTAAAGFVPMSAPPLLSAPAHHLPPLVASQPLGPARVISESRIRIRWTGPRTTPRYEICFPRGSATRPSRCSPASVCSPLLSEPLLRDCVEGICRLDRCPFPPASSVVTRLRRLTAYVW